MKRGACSAVHRYDEMAERVSEIPDDTEELVELQRYYQKASHSSVYASAPLASIRRVDGPTQQMEASGGWALAAAQKNKRDQFSQSVCTTLSRLPV